MVRTAMEELQSQMKLASMAAAMSRRSQRRDGLPGVQSWAQTYALDAGPKVRRCTVVSVPMGTVGR